MTETEENNALIAKFMQGEDLIFYHANNDNQQNIRYKESYKWLMPVVNKCLEICNNEMLNEWENSFADAFLSTSIDKLYKETVEFIKWWNNEYGKEN